MGGDDVIASTRCSKVVGWALARQELLWPHCRAEARPTGEVLNRLACHKCFAESNSVVGEHAVQESWVVV